MPWLGKKKLALVPLYRPNFRFPPDQIPDDWPGLIMRRVFFDPDQNGIDRSLRAYIHAASSGLADLDAVVQPMQSFDGDQGVVKVGDLDGRLGAELRDQGFDAAALVMLGGLDSGTSEPGGFWARFVMLEEVGVWAMEFIHCLTGFADLYPFAGNMSSFDEMDCSCGTHPSAFTKAAIQWLDPSTIALYDGRAESYDLHSIGLVQPPPTGRWAAIRRGTEVPYLMVEARQRVDQFDRGIPSEGVIVYQVQTSDPLGWAQNKLAPIQLLTTTALSPGQTFTAPDGFTVQVTSALSGGFTVTLKNLANGVTVPDLFQVDALTAAAQVEALGLVPVFSPPNPSKLFWVASQSPTAGSTAAPGTDVKMLVRQGPLQ